MRTSMLSLAASLLVLAACAPPEEAPRPEEAPPPEEYVEEEVVEFEPVELVATAVLTPRTGGTESGVVTFTQTDGTVTVTASVEGATPGKHGFHVHELGDCSAEDFTSAGGHFNPSGVQHGCPGDVEHHAGDLGNIEIGADGSGALEVTTDMLTVIDGPNTVVGRAVILHEGEDDCVSQPTGDAGGRLACGVVTAEEEAYADEAGYEEYEEYPEEESYVE